MLETERDKLKNQLILMRNQMNEFSKSKQQNAEQSNANIYEEYIPEDRRTIDSGTSEQIKERHRIGWERK